MHEPPHQPWLDLIEGYVAGTLDEAEQREFMELLLSDPAARRCYLEYMNLNAELHWQFQSREGVPLTGETCPSGMAGGASDPASDGGAAAAGRGSPTGQRFSGAFRPRGMLWAAMLMLIVGGGIWWKVTSPSAPNVVQGPPGQPETQPAASQDSLAVRLAGSETRELRLGNKGYMYVQGPADLDLIGSSRARLHRGRIRVRVTSGLARDFVVETPRGEVTHLGTEFGVDVGRDADTGVVVFEGQVEMSVVEGGGDSAQRRVERLEQGDGLMIGGAGKRDRLKSIVTGTGKTFQKQEESAADGSVRVIAGVWDNLPVAQSKKVYQIVPGGLKEDAACYADQGAYEWNGVDEQGLPAFLVGADYVKTISNYKLRRDVRIYVQLARPARLFVFLDHGVQPPRWLRGQFKDTGASIGLDEGPQWLRKNVYSTLPRGVGPGKEIDRQFSVWEMVVERPGIVELGPNLGKRPEVGMYGIAAVALQATTAAGSELATTPALDLRPR